jgi:hypothetical protein
MTATITPSRAASEYLPCVPTRYAAVTVLPWPGATACAAPTPNATASASQNTAPWSNIATSRSSKPFTTCSSS